MTRAGILPVTESTMQDRPQALQQRTAGMFLAGRTLLVTRPAGQADALVRAIAAAGGRSVLLPSMEIVAIDDNPGFDRCLAALDGYDLIMFVSANAVRETARRANSLGLPSLARVRCAAAPGPATASALAAAGVADVVTPSVQYDSEGLIEALGGRELRPARALILRGDDDEGSGAGTGRELFADWLRQGGAYVDTVACYRRVRATPDPARLAALFAGPPPDGTVVTSSEGGKHFLAILGPAGRAWLAGVPMFVPHARIAESMAALGVTGIQVTDGGDAGLMRGIAACFGGTPG